MAKRRSSGKGAAVPAAKPVWELSTEALARIGRAAGEAAIADSFARGLPVVGVENGHVVRRFPDGRKEIIKALAPGRGGRAPAGAVKTDGEP